MSAPTLAAHAIAAPFDRRDGPVKVRGAATYALTHENAPALAAPEGVDPDLPIRRADAMAHRGQIVGGRVAESSEAAHLERTT